MTQQSLQIPAKGGNAVLPNQRLAFDQIMQNQLMPVMRQLYGNWVEEQNAHRVTLRLLQAVVNGQISAERVIATDDGWQIAPEEPGSQPQEKKAVKGKAETNGADEAPIPPITELAQAGNQEKK